MEEPSDDELMLRVRAGDRGAFGQLLQRHLPGLHRYLNHMTRSSADSDELCQETFLRVWEAAGSYRSGKARFSTWLHRIGHNLCVDEMRRRRTGTASQERPENEAHPSPEQEMLLGQEHQKLLQALADLPEGQRSALLLCQVQGFSNQEAAKIMKTGVRAVESLLARGRRSLRQRLAEPDDLTEATRPTARVPKLK